MLVAFSRKTKSCRLCEAKISTVDRIWTGHPFGVTVEKAEAFIEDSVEALVRTPGFARDEPNV
jgi:hypothetical protein